MPNPEFSPVDKGSTKHVVFVLYEKVTLLDFVGATEVFNNVPGFVIHWLAPTMDPVTTSENMKVLPTGTFEDVPQGEIEVLFIPGGNYKGTIPAMFDLRYRNFIQETSCRSTWSGSVCTGAFIMAAAGGFNNCQVTTYWSQLQNLSYLKDKYGITVDLNSYPRFLLDNNKKRFSGGGVSSSIDLAFELVKQIVDNETAQKAQLFIQYAPSPPNNSGDPSQAPPQITNEVLELEANYTAHMKEGVMQLINE
ncbi:MAG: DJ-1/PfpI family protein [Saprospiraceae bacterium]